MTLRGIKNIGVLLIITYYSECHWLITETLTKLLRHYVSVFTHALLDSMIRQTRSSVNHPSARWVCGVSCDIVVSLISPNDPPPLLHSQINASHCLSRASPFSPLDAYLDIDLVQSSYRRAQMTSR